MCLSSFFLLGTLRLACVRDDGDKAFRTADPTGTHENPGRRALGTMYSPGARADLQRVMFDMRHRGNSAEPILRSKGPLARPMRAARLRKPAPHSQGDFRQSHGNSQAPVAWWRT